MPTTYSPDLRLALLGNGEGSGTWGNSTNTNLGTLLEQAICGLTSVDVTSGAVTLTVINGATDQARSAVIAATGTPSATSIITIPNVNKTYYINNTTAQPLSIKTSGGSAYTMSASSFAYVYCDGANAVVGPSSATNAVNLTGDGSGSYVTINSNNLLTRISGQQLFQNLGGTTLASIDSSGNFTAIANVTAYSDERLKSDIKTIPNALDAVDKLRGVSFVKDGKPSIGVIAQEVQQVFPELVLENTDGYLSVAYGNLVGVLIEAVKELRAEVNALKGK